MKDKLFVLLLVSGLIFSSACFGVEEKMLGDNRDGSRAVPVHLINLYDENGTKISPTDEIKMPFSMKQTCGQCHDYDTIAQGWHFNAIDPNVDPGRPGQAWIYVDASAGLQIPLAYRDWQGVFNPDDIGMTRWMYVKQFGRHLPGGIGEDLDAEPDFEARWMVSGEVEINCLACHDSSFGHDQPAYAEQISKENFVWAAAASSSFTEVTGAAKDMDEMWDRMMPGFSDDPKKRPPQVIYNENVFDHKQRVLFKIDRQVKPERCYFCHSNVEIGPDGVMQTHLSGSDVHMEAGLVCVDCHRNGLNHMITRGDPQTALNSDISHIVTSSCQGCHLGKDSLEKPVGGRAAAPKPEHAGIPLVHFEKLSCTACHSGVWPQGQTGTVKTSRAHGLGTHNSNKSPDALPHIISPVYAKGSDGKIGPKRAVWPAYWGSLNEDGKVEIVKLDVAKAVTEGIIEVDKEKAISGDWSDITTEQLGEVLTRLSKEETVAGQAVYVAGGKLFSLDDSGKVNASEHKAAKPYMWPMAHDVRPAQQSLGAKHCEDCHSIDKPFMFGSVRIDTPVSGAMDLFTNMINFQDPHEANYLRLFARTFIFRPVLKIVALGSCALIGIVLLLYSLKALSCVTRFTSEEV